MIEKIHTKLEATLLRAKQCHEIWWAFEGNRPDREEFVEIANNYKNFFVPVVGSCFFTFMLKLGSAFDDSKDSVSLQTYLKKLLASNNGLADPEKSRIEADLVGLWPKGRKLYKVRSKVFAHITFESFSTDFGAWTGFKLADLNAVLDESIELFSRMAKAHKDYDGSVFHLSPIEDLDAIFQGLRPSRT